MGGQSEVLCAACGAANLPGSRFCSSCETLPAAPQVAHILSAGRTTAG